MLAAPRRIAGLLARVRAATDAAEPPEEVLWAVWSASRWREELERLVHRPGNAPPALLRHVDRQLDAVVALFEAAARFTDRLPAAGLAVFLKGLLDQEIPADPLSQRSFTSDAVRLMTAHRSKGLEWEFVVVAGVQEGVWPDLRRRSTLLEADALAAADDEPSLFADDEAAMAARASALVDERRLFYVAVTRARRRLLVTAVSGGMTPSCGPRVSSASSGGGAAADRDRAAAAVAVRPRRRAAVRRQRRGGLAARCAQRPSPSWPAWFPTFAAAHPDRWWGLAEWTERDLAAAAGRFTGHPLAEPGRHHPHLPAALVPGAAGRRFERGQLVAGLRHVAARRRPAHRRRRGHRHRRPRTQARHALAGDRLGGALVRRPRACGGAGGAHRAARMASGESRTRSSVRRSTSISRFSCDSGVARVRGQIDLLERDREGRGRVVDYKTGRSAPAAKDAQESPQLGLYQLAVMSGAVRRTRGRRAP